MSEADEILNESVDEPVKKPSVHKAVHKAAHPIHSGLQKKSDSLSPVVIGTLIVLLIFVGFNQFQLWSLGSDISGKISSTAQASRVAQLQVTTIVDPSCQVCYPVDASVASLKKAYNVTSENSVAFDSPEGQSLISGLGITSVPALIIDGDFNKTSLQGFALVSGHYLNTQIHPPYRNLSSGQIVGLVSSIILNASNCPKCADYSGFIQSMRSAGIVVSNVSVVDTSSPKGADLISKYKITKVPAVILSNDALAYPVVTQAWPSLGTVEADGSLVVRQISLPYVDLSSGKTLGLVNVVLLNDSSCKQCYDVSEHLLILKSLSIAVDATRVVDVQSSEGKSLIAKYNISDVPTVLLSNAGDYVSFQQTWAGVGTVEKDGTYVFRAFDKWPGHAYMNLANNTFVSNPATNPSPSAASPSGTSGP